MGHFELNCCTQTLLEEVACPAMKRKDVAMTYALALKSSDKTDWRKVNRAIIERWSLAGLEWIKKQAWGGHH
jgi:hypothetical protein